MVGPEVITVTIDRSPPGNFTVESKMSFIPQYDTKMLKLQKQSIHYQQPAQSVGTSQDIYRKVSTMARVADVNSIVSGRKYLYIKLDYQ